MAKNHCCFTFLWNGNYWIELLKPVIFPGQGILNRFFVTGPNFESCVLPSFHDRILMNVSRFRQRRYNVQGVQCIQGWKWSSSPSRCDTKLLTNDLFAGSFFFLGSLTKTELAGQGRKIALELFPKKPYHTCIGWFWIFEVFPGYEL